MVTREDVQSFLDRLENGGDAAQEVESGLWLVPLQDGAELVVTYAPPVVLLRVRVMEVPPDADGQLALFRRLLEYNARDLVHGSYGLEGDHVILADTLGVDDLDFSEFRASVESITLALASHLGALAHLRATR